MVLCCKLVNEGSKKSVRESDRAGKASQQMKHWIEMKGCRNAGAQKKVQDSAWEFSPSVIALA